MNKNIGLFFGSFNPIHIGHMVIANYMVEFTDITQIWFVISPHNPFKKKASLLANNHRYYMANLATEDEARFMVSNIEFSLPQPSYTINTLTYLKEQYPTHKFSIIMGADNFLTFHKWKNAEEILNRYSIYIYPRPNIHPTITTNINISFVDAPIMEISASFIRRAIKQRKDVKYFLPAKVYQYIDDMNFYK